MKAQRIDEYYKHGCHFFGKLVVVDYLETAQQDQRWGKFNAGISLDYLIKATALVKERYGENIEVLLSVPDLVVRIKQEDE